MIGIIESILAGIIVSGLFVMLEGATADVHNAAQREKLVSRRDELQSKIAARISPIVHDLEESENLGRIESFLQSDDVSGLVQRIVTRKVRRSEDSLPSIRKEFIVVCSRSSIDVETPDISERLWQVILDGCEEFIKDAIDDEELKMLASILAIQHEEIFSAVDEIPLRTAEELTKCGFRKDCEPEYPIWGVKHLRNPYFTGRENLLKDLRQALTDNRNAALVQTISGLGGVGKTQLAVEYVYQHSSEYNIVWWLRSEDPATIADDYGRLAERLHLQAKDPKDAKAIIEEVWNFLARRTDWILIFDNASDPDSIREFLPATTTGHVLITSRHQNWQCATEFTVDPFKRGESIEFIRERVGQGDEKVASELAEELGDLPLALEQAGAFIKESGISILAYLNEFRKTRLALLEEGRPFDYPATVATTWEISLQKIRNVQKFGRAAEDLLNLCAFFAPDNIPLDVIVQGSEYLPPDLSQTCQDNLLLYGTVRIIRRYSLMGGEGSFLSIHRLVQEVIRGHLNGDARQQWSKIAVQVLDDAFPRSYNNPQCWKEGSLLLPHVLSAAGCAEDLNAAPMELGLMLNFAGFYLYKGAKFTESRTIYERALRIDEIAYGPDHPNVATIVNNLGRVLQKIGDLPRAQAHFERALRICEKIYGLDDPTVAAIVNNLGSVLRDLGDLPGAQAYYERALKIAEAAYGSDHPNVAMIVNNLGRALHDRSDLRGAQAHFERALKIAEAAYGPDHPNVAMIVNNLGRVLATLDDLPEAQVHLERALRIDEKIYGLDHPEVAVDLNNLGRVLHARRDLRGAQAHFERALIINEKTYGQDHPEIANNVNNLGLVLWDLGALPEAQVYLERALRIDEKIYGIDHLEVAVDLNNLGKVLCDRGDLQSARENFARALRINEKTYGPDHPVVAITANNIGNVLYALGDLEGAKANLRRALKIARKVYRPDHPTMKLFRDNLKYLRHRVNSQ